jgi:hypothetical protein
MRCAQVVALSVFAAFTATSTAFATLRSETKLKAFDARAWHYFGESVSIDADTIVVGARGGADAGANSGTAYVFERNRGTGNWSQVKKLTASDAAAGQYFGTAVAISGDTIVVGADGDQTLGFCTGAAYVFERDLGGAGNWGEAKKLTASDAAAEPTPEPPTSSTAT